MAILAIAVIASFSLLTSVAVMISDAESEEKSVQGVSIGSGKLSLNHGHMFTEDVDPDDNEIEKAEPFRDEDAVVSASSPNEDQLSPEHLKVPKPFCRS